MFSNIGGKIKVLAIVICILGIVASVIYGLVLMTTAEELVVPGIIVVLVGSLVSWLSVFCLYGFGELIENSQLNYEMTSKIYKEIHKKDSPAKKIVPNNINNNAKPSGDVYHCGNCGRNGPYNGNCPTCGSSVRIFNTSPVEGGWSDGVIMPPPMQQPIMQQPVAPQQPIMQQPIAPQQPIASQQPIAPQQPIASQQPIAPQQSAAPQPPVEPQPPVAPQMPTEPQAPAEPQIPVAPQAPAEPQLVAPAEPDAPRQPAYRADVVRDGNLVICPSCGSKNIYGNDTCWRCSLKLME